MTAGRSASIQPAISIAAEAAGEGADVSSLIRADRRSLSAGGRVLRSHCERESRQLDPTLARWHLRTRAPAHARTCARAHVRTLPNVPPPRPDP